MSFYDDLGVAPVINASTSFTVLGGTLMPPEVLAAMQSAAGSFVDMHELHLAAGRKLAELTGNEAAYVTAGCAAGMVLATLACRTGGDPRLIERMPGGEGTADEVVIHAAHRIPYDPAIRLAGGRLRQVGNVLQTFEWELEAALNQRTAAVLYVAGSHLPAGALPLSRVVQIAHSRDVPVLVDAAAQLPPVSNLWHYTTELGADLALFSGGKALHGPQASGLMVGRADLVEAARQNGAPFQRLARAMKAGKEEIAGLVAAVARYVSLDHEAQARQWLGTVERWQDRLSTVPGVTATPDLLNEAGQPVPRLYVSTDAAVTADAASVVDRLRDGTPGIAVLPDRVGGEVIGFWIGPDLLQPGEEEIVLQRVTALVQP